MINKAQCMDEYYRTKEAQEASLQSALTIGMGVTRLNYLNGKFIVEHIKPEEFCKDL